MKLSWKLTNCARNCFSCWSKCLVPCRWDTAQFVSPCQFRTGQNKAIPLYAGRFRPCRLRTWKLSGIWRLVDILEFRVFCYVFTCSTELKGYLYLVMSTRQSGLTIRREL